MSISENAIISITDEFKSQLDERNYDYDSRVVDSIVRESIKNKSALIEMFSKHPKWDSDKLMITFDADFSRRINNDVIYEFLKWLEYNTGIRDISTVDGWFGRNLLDEVFKIGYDNIIPNEENITDCLGRINALKEEFRFRPGMKTSRVINKICTSFGWDKLPENVYIDKYGVERNYYDLEFAKYSDALNPLKVTRHTSISVNPVDFLLMSHGNSWQSCHYIGRNMYKAGCYSSGTLSYALDKHSFIFYTVSADYNGDRIETEPKILRQVFGYNDNQLLQSRLYPQENDSGAEQTYTDIRNILQSVITECKDVPNRWIKKAVRNVWRGDGATCYTDWEYNNKCNVSILRDFEDKADTLQHIIMGAKPRCIKCGEYHSYSENINHCNGTITCENCGCEIEYEDDIRWVDGHAYCEGCVEWCSRCEEYHLREDCTWIDNEDTYVCEDCRDKYYSYCECCDEWYRNSKMRIVNDHDICRYCFENMCNYCEECSNPFFEDDLEEIDGCYYCHKCAEKVRAEMEKEETA